jgi:hypothetical protein
VTSTGFVRFLSSSSCNHHPLQPRLSLVTKRQHELRQCARLFLFYQLFFQKKQCENGGTEIVGHGSRARTILRRSRSSFG